MEWEDVLSWCVVSFANSLPLPSTFFPPSFPPSLPPSFFPDLIKNHHKRYTRQAKARLERLLGSGVDEEMREVGPLPLDETEGCREGRGREGRKVKKSVNREERSKRVGPRKLMPAPSAVLPPFSLPPFLPPFLTSPPPAPEPWPYHQC